MAKKKLCGHYGILGLCITFLETDSPLGEKSPPRGEVFFKHLLDVRNNGCRINRFLESEQVHLCHA